MQQKYSLKLFGKKFDEYFRHSMNVSCIRTRLRRGKWFIFDSLNDQSICFVSIGANNSGIMVDSIQQLMILGMREAQIMLLPDQIDFCLTRLSQINNLKVKKKE